MYSDDCGTMFFNLKTMSTTFELRDAAIDRAKKRLGTAKFIEIYI